jgi:hypothetical protein
VRGVCFGVLGGCGRGKGGRVLVARASETARWIVGWIRCVWEISTFCWRWRRKSSGSTNFFFVIGMPAHLLVSSSSRNMQPDTHPFYYPHPPRALLSQ